jgi:hypothetical protein
MRTDSNRKPLVPGTHVRTPWGLAWVNVAPADVHLAEDEVWIRLGDDSTRRIEAHGCTIVDF